MRGNLVPPLIFAERMDRNQLAVFIQVTVAQDADTCPKGATPSGRAFQRQGKRYHSYFSLTQLIY